MGMGHCVYYACNMQGTAGMAEDGRQPPYLCPVCLTKISHAVACELQSGNEEGRMEYLRKRYGAIAEFCAKWEGNGLFAGYRAWALARLDELEEEL
jgi:archaemetzincin